MHMRDREKSDKKEFIKILNPITTWVINNSNGFFESIQTSMQNNIKDNDLEFGIQFTFKDEHPQFEFGNTFIRIYQFQRTEDILKTKEQIKKLLKAKSAIEFERIEKAIEL